MEDINAEPKQKVQEKVPQHANVRYDIYFSPHGNLGDFQDLFQRIKGADVYVPEVFGWSQEYLGIYEDVSAGRKTPEQAIKEKQVEDAEMNPLLLEELRAVHNSNKPIFFIDLPEDEVPRGKNRIALAARSFDGLLDNVQHYLEEESRLNIRREQQMVEQLGVKVGEVLEANPELKSKDDVKVLISLGSVHTGVYRQLKDNGEKVEREFNSMPHMYSFSDEGVRSYMNDKPVSRELAARILLETVFGDVFQPELEKASEDNTKIDLFKRKVASQFSLDEIGGIFHLLTYTDWNYFKGSFEGYMNYQMETKGLKMPKSEQELDEIVNAGRV